MKRLIYLLFVIAACGCAAPTAKRRFLVSFHKPSTVLIVDECGNILWKAKPAIRHPQDCAVTAAGNVLVSDYTGVLAIGIDNKVRWRCQIPPGTQNPLACPLGPDRFLIGVEGPTLLREINRAGRILKELKVNTSYPKTHGQFRVCRKTAQGTYLVPFTLEGALREYRGDGHVVRDFGRYKLVVGALRLPNGNTLVSYVDGIVEVGPDGTTVWEFNTKRDSPLPFAPMVGIAKLKNGNILAGFYSSNPEIPALIEITPHKNVIYSLKVCGHSNLGHFQLLDDNFRPSPQVLVR